MATHILLVDDEEDFVETLAERLDNRGFAVAKVFSGDEALAWLDEHDTDVVILDVVMPGKDGMETLKEIKNKKPLIEVVMLTGHATVQTAIDGMKLGAYDYLMKPTDMGDLVAKVEGAQKRKTDHEERIRQAEIDRIVRTRGW